MMTLFPEQVEIIGSYQIEELLECSQTVWSCLMRLDAFAWNKSILVVIKILKMALLFAYFLF